MGSNPQRTTPQDGMVQMIAASEAVRNTEWLFQHSNFAELYGRLVSTTRLALAKAEPMINIGAIFLRHAQMVKQNQPPASIATPRTRNSQRHG